MASGALFGGTSTRSQSKNLVEFRAGKMYMKGKMVHPDKRKGLLYVYQSDDSLMHFCWKDRSKGSVEDVSWHNDKHFFIIFHLISLQHLSSPVSRPSSFHIDIDSVIFLC